MLLPYPDVGALIASGDGWWDPGGADTGERHRLDDISYAPLIVRPSKIVVVESNYVVGHGSWSVPSLPSRSSPCGTAAVSSSEPTTTSACRPRSRMHWGVELGVVIGRRPGMVMPKQP
ncbi:hypothetical protein OHA71_16205 [Streptomyces sp. NBC_00444]|uniref:hypothetical protein n=1 Tax=Streptomyces sp. NBC_00444 TaxID=2975744 RepID=UPI002E1B15CD